MNAARAHLERLRMRAVDAAQALEATYGISESDLAKILEPLAQMRESLAELGEKGE